MDDTACAGADREGVQDREEINFLIRIKEFRWDEVNERHILWRHDVTRSEAEEAFIGDRISGLGGMVRDMFTVKQVVGDTYLSYICILGGALPG